MSQQDRVEGRLMPRRNLGLAVNELTEEQSVSFGLRVNPQQRRSLEKVGRILEAASELLVESGYDQLLGSPEALIERAAVSGGVFYRYFLNVETVLDALGLHYLNLARQLIDDLVEYPEGGAEGVFDRVIDAYLGFYKEPAVRELWLNDHLSSRVRAQSTEVNRYIEHRIDQMLRGAQDPIRLSGLEVHIALQIAEHLLRLSMRENHDSSADVVRHAKLAVRAYILSVREPAE